MWLNQLMHGTAADEASAAVAADAEEAENADEAPLSPLPGISRSVPDDHQDVAGLDGVVLHQLADTEGLARPARPRRHRRRRKWISVTSVS